VNGDSYIQISNWKKHQNPHCAEAASEIPAPVENDKSTGKNSARKITKKIKSVLNLIKLLKIKMHITCMVQAQQEPVENNLNPADSFNLIPDSLNPDPDSLITPKPLTLLAVR
jgi:hypothetical protein